MKLYYLDLYDTELIDFLSGIKGINNINIKENGVVSTLEIDFDDHLTPFIIGKYLNLYDKSLELIRFEKKKTKNLKKFKYTMKELCCDYCYLNLIKELYYNSSVFSVKSDFIEKCINTDMQHKEIIFEILLEKNCSKSEIIDIINKYC